MLQYPLQWYWKFYSVAHKSDARNNEVTCQVEADHTDIHDIWMFFWNLYLLGGCNFFQSFSKL